MPDLHRSALNRLKEGLAARRSILKTLNNTSDRNSNRKEEKP